MDEHTTQDNKRSVNLFTLAMLGCKLPLGTGSLSPDNDPTKPTKKLSCRQTAPRATLNIKSVSPSSQIRAVSNTNKPLGKKAHKANGKQACYNQVATNRVDFSSVSQQKTHGCRD
jgi:hypothetical protein